MRTKKTCQWANLNNGISTLCGKQINFYGEDMKYCCFCGGEIVYKKMPRTLEELPQIIDKVTKESVDLLKEAVYGGRK